MGLGCPTPSRFSQGRVCRMDIKETMEVMAGVDAPLVSTIEAYKDGKFDFPADLKEYADDITAAKEAIAGIQLVPEELKDLDKEEVVQLVVKSVELGKHAIEVASIFMKKQVG